MQLAQTSVSFQDIVNWSNNIVTNKIVDYTESQSSTDESTTSTSYTALTNFTQKFNINNPLCLVNFNLSLKGAGIVGVFVNEFLVSEIYFETLSFIPVHFGNYIVLRNGTNSVSLRWRALTGTIEKGNTSTHPGFNNIQVISFNS